MKELHPIEALLLVAMAAVWAVWTIARAVLVPAVALVLALLPVAPAASTAPAEPEPAPPAPAPAPMPHPLIEVAEAVAADLATSTVAELRRLARHAGLPRQLARAGRKAELLQALAAWEVAAC